MSRRGPRKIKGQSSTCDVTGDPVTGVWDERYAEAGTEVTVFSKPPPSFLFGAVETIQSSKNSPQRFDAPGLALSAVQYELLGYYINYFSVTYPAFCGLSTPFRTKILPVALKNETVLNALLSLAGLQAEKRGLSVKKEALLMRAKALSGCRNLLGLIQTQINSGLMTSCSLIKNDELLYLLMSALLLLISEKLSGEATWKPHLIFACHLFRELHKVEGGQVYATASSYFTFVYHCFLFNDLVASFPMQEQSSSGSYLQYYYLRESFGYPSAPSETQFRPRFWTGKEQYYFPSVLSQIMNGDESATLEDIDRWDGNMHWLPGFPERERCAFEDGDFTSVCCSYEAGPDDVIVADIHRAAAKIVYYQKMRALHRDSNKRSYAASFSTSNAGSQGHSPEQEIEALAALVASLIEQLPEDSRYESSLLLSIKVVSCELGCSRVRERKSLLQRLDVIHQRRGLGHYGRFREFLAVQWGEGEEI